MTTHNGYPASEWGLTHHHEDLVFYPIYEAHDAWDQAPSIVVRIVRDAAGAAVDLVIEEFNWEDSDRSPRFAQIRMNFL